MKFPKHWLAAFIAVAAVGAGCDSADRPTDDRLVPKSGDTQTQTNEAPGVTSPGTSPGNVSPQQGAPRESGGGMDAGTDDTQNLEDQKNRESLQRSQGDVSNEPSGAPGPGETQDTQAQSQPQAQTQTQTTQTEQGSQQTESSTLSQDERTEREGRRVASKKKAAKKQKKAASEAAPSPAATPGHDEHTSTSPMDDSMNEQAGGEEMAQSQSESQPQSESRSQDQQAQSQLEQAENAQSEYDRSMAQAERGAQQSCNNDPFSHAPFLRSDIAYGVTGMDCEGDVPLSYSLNQGLPREARENMGRIPASDKEQTCANHDSWDHPLWLRQDIAYGVTGEDCYGDLPYSSGSDSMRD